MISSANVALVMQNTFLENALKNTSFSSDTIALNLLILVLFGIAIFGILFLQIAKFKCQNLSKISRTISVYYLAFILLKYGFDKIFKSQFYLPEPNILYSQFKDLSCDILYWSTIGTSRFYSISLGIIEVFTAVLLLINRTRIIGLLLSIGVFINIIIINFGFDISVKTFSILLLSMTIYTLFPDLKLLYDFFIRRKQSQLNKSNYYFIKSTPIRFGIKTFVLGLFLIFILLPYFESKNFNDDVASRPFLHGVYQVIDSNQNSNVANITRFYIHRKNYLIFENKNGKQTDYFFELNQSKKQIKLIDYQLKAQVLEYEYSNKDSILKLIFPNFKIISKAENWRKSEVLKNDFHFTIDAVK